MLNRTKGGEEGFDTTSKIRILTEEEIQDVSGGIGFIAAVVATAFTVGCAAGAAWGFYTRANLK